jgi:hypothetical protein
MPSLEVGRRIRTAGHQVQWARVISESHICTLEWQPQNISAKVLGYGLSFALVTVISTEEVQ